MLQEAIEKLEKLLPDKVGEDLQEEYAAYLALSGTTDERLDELEQRYSIELPADFRTFYRYKDGSGYHFHILYPTYNEECISPFYLLSLDEIQETKGFFCSEDELLSTHFVEEEIARLDSRIKPYYSNRKWLPIAHLGGGSLYLMLDFDPAPGGKPGQVIAFIHDPDFIYYVAGSFTELLAASNANLEEWEEIDY